MFYYKLKIKDKKFDIKPEFRSKSGIGSKPDGIMCFLISQAFSLLFFKQSQEREFKVTSKEQNDYAMELIPQSYALV